MNIKDLRNKSNKELHKILAQTRAEVKDLQFKTSNKQLKNLRQLRMKKREVARILTAINNPIIAKTEKPDADKPSAKQVSQAKTKA